MVESVLVSVRALERNGNWEEGGAGRGGGGSRREREREILTICDSGCIDSSNCDTDGSSRRWVSVGAKYQAFPTRIMYLCYVSCFRYTILVGNPQYAFMLLPWTLSYIDILHKIMRYYFLQVHMWSYAQSFTMVNFCTKIIYTYILCTQAISNVKTIRIGRHWFLTCS